MRPNPKSKTQDRLYFSSGRNALAKPKYVAEINLRMWQCWGIGPCINCGPQYPRTDPRKWVYVNEASGTAAEAAADHQGTHEADLKREKFNNARVQNIICMLSAIEKH